MKNIRELPVIWIRIPEIAQTKRKYVLREF